MLPPPSAPEPPYPLMALQGAVGPGALTWSPIRGAVASSWHTGPGSLTATTNSGMPHCFPPPPPLLPGVRSLTLRCLELVLTPQELNDAEGVRAPPLPLSLVLPGLRELSLVPQFEPRPGADVGRISGEGMRGEARCVRGRGADARSGVSCETGAG